jgi:hypothetical protein
MSKSGAGKGDDYRPVDLKKYNATLDRIFGEKDIREVQKCRKTIIKLGEKTDSIVLAELNKNSGKKIVSDEDFRRAEKEINAAMEKFDIEHRAYMAQSRISASKAFLNF